MMQHQKDTILLALYQTAYSKLPFISLAFLFLIASTSLGLASPPKECDDSITESTHTLMLNTENFTGDATGTTTFTAPTSEDFLLTGFMRVDFGVGQGTSGDDQWAGTPLNTVVNNAIGAISICETTKAFQISEIDCWTSTNGGANFAVGDVTFIGYLHGGGTVSYTTTVTPTDNITGYDPVSFSGTALDGVNLTSLQFVLLGEISYFAIDDIDYSVTTGLSAFNSVPTVSDVVIAGTLAKGASLTASYTYYDCVDAESGSTHQWYRADDADGTNKAAISGATTKNYTLVPFDTDKYISYEAIPADANGSGVASTSEFYGPVTCGIASYLEDFEDNSGTSFTNNSQAFTIAGPSAVVATFGGAGWNGSVGDDKFIDNDGEADNNDGAAMSITTTDGTDILVRSFYVYCSEDDYTKNAAANLTITGKKDNVTIFTFTKSSGFNTTSTDNGFNFIDLSVEGGSDNSETLIDELVLSTTGIYDYLAIDAFNWATLTLSSSTLTTTGISTFDATSATMGGEVTDDGCAAVSESGVVYNTSGSPTVADTKVSVGSGMGTYSQSITGLTESTQYYIRSYAINSEGTSYGSQQTFTTSAALPVEIISFEGRYADQSVQLSWETSSESQNKGYHIRRRVGAEWEKVGFVEGKGTHQGLRTYQYLDEVNVHDEKLYYQLAQEDMDGSLHYSRVVAIFRDLASEIVLFPNPAKEILQISSSDQDLKQFQLYDLQGRLVWQESLAAREAVIDLKRFPKGYYTTIILSENGQKVSKSLFIR